jgi:hypothetical protein
MSTQDCGTGCTICVQTHHNTVGQEFFGFWADDIEHHEMSQKPMHIRIAPLGIFLLYADIYSRFLATVRNTRNSRLVERISFQNTSPKKKQTCHDVSPINSISSTSTGHVHFESLVTWKNMAQSNGWVKLARVTTCNGTSGPNIKIETLATHILPWSWHEAWFFHSKNIVSSTIYPMVINHGK